MTKKELRNKFRFLKKETNKQMNVLFEKALKSGALDIKSYDNDSYVLPRIIITAISKELAFQWTPLGPKDKKEANNLKYFL